MRALLRRQIYDSAAEASATPGTPTKYISKPARQRQIRTIDNNALSIQTCFNEVGFCPKTIRRFLLDCEFFFRPRLTAATTLTGNSNPNPDPNGGPAWLVWRRVVVLGKVIFATWAHLKKFDCASTSTRIPLPIIYVCLVLGFRHSCFFGGFVRTMPRAEACMLKTSRVGVTIKMSC